MRNLFNPRPKSSRRELYDREEELNFLDGNIEKPLILVLGVRRIGKTSLLKAFLEPHKGIYIDMRGVSTYAELYGRLADSLSEGLGKLREALSDIRGVEIMGISVSLRWRGRDSISLTGLLEELNKRGRFVLVLDEVQETRQAVAIEIRRAIAYAYDHLENITIILSGSQIGLLEKFAALSDPKSPLYGRYAARLQVKRFSPDQSREFLKLGFREVGATPPEDAIEEAVRFFDGIPGWLVHFGISYLDGAPMESIREAAIAMALEELSKLNKRERLALRAIAEGANTWASVRRHIEETLGETVPKSTMSRIIDKLEALSIIKDYSFLDNVYREAAKRLK